MDGETTHEIPPAGETTEQYPTLAGAPGIEGLEESPFADPDDEWPVRGPARGIRLGFPAAGLLVVLLVAAGFWGGSVVQKHHGQSSGGLGGGAASALARLRGLASGTTGASGASGSAGTGFGFGGGGFGGAAAGTAGTISVVDGDTLYILTSSGSLVKVTLGPSTTITREASTAAKGLRPGDTVVVQGSTAANGNVSATSVAATAPGVSSSSGFDRDFGGGGDATGAGSAG